jgi:ABC-type protease/lipase transport system fused ATPase/permease subunit
MKGKGAAVVVIGHRPSTLSQVERILVLRDGRVAMFGPRSDVMEALKRQRVQPIPPQPRPAVPAAPQAAPQAAPSPASLPNVRIVSSETAE